MRNSPEFRAELNTTDPSGMTHGLRSSPGAANSCWGGTVVVFPAQIVPIPLASDEKTNLPSLAAETPRAPYELAAPLVKCFGCPRSCSGASQMFDSHRSRTVAN